VIYEGFSNFQDFVKEDSQYTNKLIAANADLFKSWGITSFEIAPQYVSSKDGTFLDSIIENGYAFTDRYDFAMSKNNKYGSKKIFEMPSRLFTNKVFKSLLTGFQTNCILSQVKK